MTAVRCVVSLAAQFYPFDASEQSQSHPKVSNSIAAQELKDLTTNPLDDVTVEPKDDNLFEWNCSIKAAADSPYKNGTFHFTVSLPTNFPFKAPLVTFKTKIYHPGINDEGAICVPVLRDEWKPSVTLSTVLVIIQEKLNNPSPDDPFEPDVAAVLKNDKSKFLATAKDWTKNKKSETGRSVHAPALEDHDHLSSPQIPLPNDFRTSLILPDLSRRFSLLRSSSGEPVALDVLRSRLADQRARGAANHISEEEEEMIFDTLRSFRSKPNAASLSGENLTLNSTSNSYLPVQENYDFRQSSSTMMSSSAASLAPSSASPSVTSSPSKSTGKRYSNNLFGSGRFNDYNYLRSVTKQGGGTSGNGRLRTESLTPTESSVRNVNASTNTSSLSDSTSLRPVTPESSGYNTNSIVSSVQSTPSLHDIFSGSSDSRTAMPLSTPYGEQGQGNPVSVAGYRISKTLGPSALKRASMALEEVIKEFEEEAEDEILMPRSPPIPPSGNVELANPHPRNSALSTFEAVMAISSDKQVQNDPEVVDRRASPVPSRILPGYVPGMPRPMTPRDRDAFDIEDQRSHSTTPRATTPMAFGFADASVAQSISSVPSLASSSSTATSTNTNATTTTLNTTTARLRSNSSTSQTSVTRSPTSPLFLQRSPNSNNTGRHTPVDNSARVEFDTPLNSSLLARRRPASPLAGPPYQPMAVSSRPGTPSNVVWAPSRSHTRRGHTRNNSSLSESGASMSNSDAHGAQAHERYTSGPRPMRSPPLPDSPMIEAGSFALGNSTYGKEGDGASAGSGNGDGPPAMTPGEFGSLRRPPPRSATPTQSAARSPTSPTFEESIASPGNKRSSKQNITNSNHNSIPPLVLSPLFNTSRSSLESAGSSYHTWEDEEKDLYISLFSDPDAQQTVWHDLTQSSSSGTQDSADTDSEDWNPEEVVARVAGLTKVDFLAIQEKLLSVSDAKTVERAALERAGSMVRKRRPSTSQSHYSINGKENRVASPPPQVQVQTSPSRTASQPSENIKHDRIPAALDTSAPSPPGSPRDRDLSPTTKRNRALATALFGQEPDGGSVSKSESTASSTTAPEPPKPPATTLESHSSNSTLSPPFKAPYQLSRNPSVPRIPQTPQEEAQLAREVQERINAATELLKPSNGGHSPDPNATISRKRISPSQISTPRLVSASTTVVDTIPIVKAPSPASSANSSAPSKIGSRFKKLRGTLRAKNPPILSGEELPAAPASGVDPHSPSGAQMATYDPAKLRVPGPHATSSATETRFKVAAASPPASAGPGLKGFMARFRGKQRHTIDASAESDRRRSPHDSIQPTPQPTSPAPVAPPSPLGRKPVPDVSRPETPYEQAEAPSSPPTQSPYVDSSLTPKPTESSDVLALKQFFEAANRIGIDQGELNALLARSGSTSSKAADWSALTRSSSTVRPEAGNPADPSRLTPSRGRTSLDEPNSRALTPDSKVLDRGNGRPSIDATRDKSVSRQASRKQADHTRRPREGKGGEQTAVVRKTIIIPDKAMTFEELKLEMEKTMPGHRASITSTSSRSIHERAPTPPPPRSPTGKRFSRGPPPVPDLPSVFGNSLNVPSTAAGPLEKSNSTYDSLYDMYAGEYRSPSATPNESGPSSRPQDDLAVGEGAGAAVELIQLANGQTIWNIVNGLREEDDDDMSVYTRRTSFASEYHPRGVNGGSDAGIQMFVKEHRRSGSRGSASSFLSRKKNQGKSRPETKIYQSPAEGIGRLIQELSQNMEAGSFNIVPRPGHSASSSLSTNDITWTLEERLDEMIDKVRAK
ncbi:hypothetical protein DXG03_001091 [Asterophora parasitica]|uniref:UBC core domain-containing protein n=1 Tax=Asterophora parasitica TaxID=117018 RepID=A0A9P7GC37_9AGAR|nr:hypothetical protein DXG03_001091 [Asterophora parasitica]